MLLLCFLNLKNILLFLNFYCLQIIYCNKNNNEYIKKLDENYLIKNFNILSKKENLQESINNFLFFGNLTLLNLFLQKLSINKIKFLSNLENSIYLKTSKLSSLYNKLKYKDEIGIQNISPAFEWSEGTNIVILRIKYSSRLNSLACNEVDDEKFEILPNKKNIIYSSKCIYNNYQMNFKLELRLYKEVQKTLFKYNKERGCSIYYLKKIEQQNWDRLLDIGYALPHNSFSYNLNLY